MQIAREDAVAIFAGAGVQTAHKWSDEKMLAKLSKIHDELGDELEDTATDRTKKVYKKALKAAKAGEAFELTGEAAKAPTPPPAPEKPKKEKKEEKPAKAEKPAKEQKEKDSPEGVRNSRSRPYIAGLVIKKYGIEAGATQKMADEIDAAYGKPNPKESMFVLRNAWHAIRGWIEKNAETKLEEKASAE